MSTTTMNERALPADDLRPQRPGGLGRGALLALLAHIGLIVALAIGVNWRASEPAATSAELWAQVPQAAAPRLEQPLPQPAPAPTPEPKVQAAPPPKPVPSEADIALEAQKKKEAEQRARAQAEKEAAHKKAEAARERAEQEAIKRKQAEADKQRLAEAQRRREQAEREADEKRIQALREENLRRMLGQAGGSGAPTATGSAAREAGPSAGYAGRIVARIRPNIVLLDTVPGNPMAAVEVRAAPDGTIIGRRLLKSSGNAAWDDAVLRAIDRTEMLPRDIDGRVPALITIEFRPRD
jgi:colicin import membrane protein